MGRLYLTQREYDALLEKQTFDPLSLIMSTEAAPIGKEAEGKTSQALTARTEFVDG